MLWTSGWPAHQQRSVSLSRSCITPAKPIGRGKQGVWERQGSRARWDAKGNRVSMLMKNLELVQVTPHQALHQKPCGPGGRVMSPPERQSSSTASPNSQEVVSHHYWGSLYCGYHLVCTWFSTVAMCCSFRCLHYESGHLPLQSLLESYEEYDGYKPKIIRPR